MTDERIYVNVLRQKVRTLSLILRSSDTHSEVPSVALVPYRAAK